MSSDLARTDLVRAAMTNLIDDESVLERGPRYDGVDSDAVRVAAHIELRSGPYGDLVRAMCWPTSAVPDLVATLTTSALDPISVVLVADSGVLGVQQATTLLLDDDRIELVGLRVALPRNGDPEVFARHVLSALTFAMPTSVEIPPVDGWRRALDRLAEDGAERAAFRPIPQGKDDIDCWLASALVACAARQLQFELIGGVADAPDAVQPSGKAEAMLRLIDATSRAWHGASVADVHAVLGAKETTAWPSSYLPAALPRQLNALGTSSPGALVAELVAVGALQE